MTTSLPSIPRPQAAEAALPILLRQLRLAWIRCHWQSIASQAEGEGWSHSQFLYALCEQEVEQRQQARQHRLLRAAHLPWSKALADYDHGGRIETHLLEVMVLFGDRDIVPLSEVVKAAVDMLPEPQEGQRDTRRQMVTRALTNMGKEKEGPLRVEGGQVIFYE